MTEKQPDSKILEKYDLLPGPMDARILLPIDYPPSAALQPRWGFSHPVHQGLCSLFSKQDAEYIYLLKQLRGFAPYFSKIPRISSTPEAMWAGNEINGIDLALLYHMLATAKPKNYVEIGSGLSTWMAERCIRDQQLQTTIISIDPQPRKSIAGVAHESIRAGLETLQDLSLFSSLSAGDIVFFDGTHRAFMNSDVTVFMLDILPLLAPGVLIHFHDIALPFDYHAYFKERYWNEQYLLATYLLAAAEKVRIIFPCHYCCHSDNIRAHLEPPILEGIHKKYSQNGWSFWFAKVQY